MTHPQDELNFPPPPPDYHHITTPHHTGDSPTSSDSNLVDSQITATSHAGDVQILNHLNTQETQKNEQDNALSFHSFQDIQTNNMLLEDENNFPSSYTDTVHSNGSSSQLINQTNETPPDQVVSEIHLNDAYVPTSEVPNEHENLKENDEINPLIVDNKQVNTSPVIYIEDFSNNNNSKNETGKLEDPTLKYVEDYVHNHLLPIGMQDGDLTSFKINEILPSKYPRITKNFLTVDESFLFGSQSSLPNVRNNGKRAPTMQNLHERASFTNLTTPSNLGRTLSNALIYLKDDVTFGSMAALNKLKAKDIEQDILISEEKAIDVVPSNNHMKNLLAISFSIVLMFIAIGSVRNLQSSINHEGGVGIMSMVVSFIGYMLGSLISPTLVQSFQPKNCLLLSLIPHFTYVAANIYPEYWLMFFASLAQGISLAIIWNAMSTYVTLLSRGRSQSKNEEYTKVSGRYFGIFGLIYQSYFIVGNLIASIILSIGGPSKEAEIGNNFTKSNVSTQILNTPLNNLTTNFSLVAGHSVNKEENGYLHLCGAYFWQHYDLGGDVYLVPVQTKFILFGTYMGCIVIAFLIGLFMLEPLNKRLLSSEVRPLLKMKRQMILLGKHLISLKFILIFPLLLHSFMQVGFYTAEMTKAFVTCPLGMHMVGYVMMFMGVCASLTSYFSGLLVPFLGRLPQIVFAQYLQDITAWRRVLCLLKSTILPLH